MKFFTHSVSDYVKFVVYKIITLKNSFMEVVCAKHTMDAQDKQDIIR